ncbi:S-layer homology domain-containing protein [Peptoniphilus sp. KCTC 25270]|uniref:S-layer homology domain-containing protein n=1 Tax=Peptoniphilus sp. KCTC 25270 TaxID=2897414 RepID=UPI001E64C755|nr:S-layer homology domain-containing protein [Peptoniphilus sp. KCTC 25270]MCD1147641.1 S-layer homology domain-containing protein [Peptoniphilus sp. KCTC 25270]
MKQRKKYLSSAAMALALSLALQSGIQAASYQDMPGENHWSYKGLNYCIQKEYIKGIDSLHISPNSLLTRAQMATIMNRVKETKETTDISRFKDVKVEDWFYNEIEKAVKAGFINGRSQTEMAPNENITREEAFTILARVLGEKTAGDKISQYKDGSVVSSWAKSSVNQLIEAKIVTGDENGLRPKENITRAEFAQIVYKAFAGKEETKEENGKEKEKAPSALSTPETKPGFPGKPSKPEGKEKTVYGDANVDQQQYPVVKPFIHPPFYNVRVKVDLDKEGKIKSVTDNETATKGLAPGKTSLGKNEAYFQRLDQKVYDKFKGLDRAGVVALKMETGEADVVSGATETGKALKQAVLNAYDGKAGKKFLENDQTLVAGPVEKTEKGYEVFFKNNLPKDFKVKYLSVNQGIYNGENYVDNSKVEWKAEKDGFRLIVKDANAITGKYFVNIVDENGNYRSPDFESGHGSPRKYPYLVIEGGSLSYENGKVKVSDNNFENFQKNIEEIIIQEWDVTEDKAVEGSKAVEVEPVGHHGNKGSYADAPMIKADGTIDGAAVAGRNKAPVFAEGKMYKITVETFGYGSVEFLYQGAKEESEVTPEPGEKVYEGSSPVGHLGYDYVVKIKMKGGVITGVDDSETRASQGSEGYLENYRGAKKLDYFRGKTKAESLARVKQNTEEKIEKNRIDTVSNATETSVAAISAMEEALSKVE